VQEARGDRDPGRRAGGRASGRAGADTAVNGSEMAL
jgi:hypothetical protein